MNKSLGHPLIVQTVTEGGRLFYEMLRVAYIHSSFKVPMILLSSQKISDLEIPSFRLFLLDSSSNEQKVSTSIVSFQRLS